MFNRNLKIYKIKKIHPLKYIKKLLDLHLFLLNQILRIMYYFIIILEI
jgi:hypothetical protein